ncbi:MAG: hypothetical protein KY395_04605, partial [Actinobacteria bacterium]|nr:hypothetical protein [Actinomycetota bacterium]
MAVVVTLEGRMPGAAYDLPSIALRRPRSETAAEADAAAFAEFYSVEFPRLAGYCRALVGSESAARDI